MEIEEIEERLGIKLDQWQRDFVKDKSPQVILKMGRKCGKSTALSFKIVYDSVNENFSHTDGICILSKGQRQAKELLLQVKAMLIRIGYVFARDPEEEKNEAYGSAFLLKLPNGNKIYALPSGFDGATIRYYSFYKMIRDEDAFIPDAVDAAVSACLAVHGKQEIRASTPYGTSGSFYQSWFNPDFKRYERATTSCQRVSKQFLLREKRRLTKVEFEQEYLARFMEEAEGIYTGALIARCTTKEPINWEELKKSCIVFMGVDFARFGEDENCIAINFYNPETKISTVKVIIISSKFRTTHVSATVKNIADTFPRFRCVVTDEGGVGGGATDILVEQLGKRKVLGIVNQKKTEEIQGQRNRYIKVDMHTNLIKLMETDKIIFDDDMNIVRSLRCMKYRYTVNNELTIYGRNNHAAEAIVRAVFPLKLKKAKGIILPVSAGIKSFFTAEDIYSTWQNQE